jgi:hypothetical protein
MQLSGTAQGRSRASQQPEALKLSVALEFVQPGNSVQTGANPVQTGANSGRRSRRNRAMTAAITTIATLLILGTVASMTLANQFRNQRNESEYARYVSDIQAANFHLQNNSTAMAQRILMNVPEAHRDWE